MYMFVPPFQDQKKLQGQLITEQEAIFGSKPSPMKSQNLKKGARYSCGGVPSSRRLSLGGAMLQTPKANMLNSIKGTPNTRQNKRNERPHQDNRLNYKRDDEVAALSAGNNYSNYLAYFCSLFKYKVNISQWLKLCIRSEAF